MDQLARKSDACLGLTCIPRRIHCGTTLWGEDLSETEQFQLRNFFQVLADVALAVASRTRNKEDEK